MSIDKTRVSQQIISLGYDKESFPQGLVENCDVVCGAFPSGKDKGQASIEVTNSQDIPRETVLAISEMAINL